MSNHVNHRRKTRRIRKRPEWVYEHPKAAREDPIEKVDIPAQDQMDIISALAGYFRRKSNLAISLGALAPCDRDYYEAVMGDAAIRALPYFDPSKGVRKTTFVISCVENHLVNESVARKQLKRKAVLVPITTADIREAQERGLVSEEDIAAGRPGRFADFLVEMDFRQFLSSLTPLERLLLDYRLNDLTFAEIADLRGMAVTTWKRREWRPVQEKAVKFGGLEPHGAEWSVDYENTRGKA